MNTFLPSNLYMCIVALVVLHASLSHAIQYMHTFCSLASCFTFGGAFRLDDMLKV
jgi:hypothetical protein